MSQARLQQIIASPWFTWIAGAAGMLIYFLLKLLPIPSWIIPDEMLETPTPVFIPIIAVAVLWLAKLIILDFRAYFRRGPRDFLYRKVTYRWHYQTDGTVSGSCIFDVENRSPNEIEKLPVEGLIWYSEITNQTIKFRIIVRESERFHRFEDDQPIVSKLDKIVDFVRSRSGFQLAWSPKIIPSLAPGETIAYEVEITTPGTEHDAFKPTGTSVGFPVSRYTDKVELDAFSPPGYRFVRLTPDVTVSGIEDGEATSKILEKLPKPRISLDGSHAEWNIDFPLTSQRYYFHYRFESKC